MISDPSLILFFLFSHLFPGSSKFLNSKYFFSVPARGFWYFLQSGGEKKLCPRAAASDNLFFYLFLCVVEASENMLLLWCVWGQWLCDSRVSLAVCFLRQLCLKSASPGGHQVHWQLLGNHFLLHIPLSYIPVHHCDYCFYY